MGRMMALVPVLALQKRSDFGFPEEGFVFCSFNHDYKINPPMFKFWMDLLKEVPGSVLWLMKLNETAQANLTKEALNHEFDPARLVYATRVPRVEDHLAWYRLADLFSDTFTYNGHTTAGDALSVGLPVVTACGNSFAFRVAGSLMHDIGVTDLVFKSLIEFHDKALFFSSNKNTGVSIENALLLKVADKRWSLSSLTQAEALQTFLKGL